MALRSSSRLHKIRINDITAKLRNRWSNAECEARCKLATAYRLVERNSWDDLIYGHLTYRIPNTHDFLINPFGLLFNEVTAASLIKIDTEGNVLDPGITKFSFQKTGYVLHSAIHESRADLNALFHVHTREGVAVSSAPSQLHTVFQDQTLLGEFSYHKYRGIVVDDAEKEAIANSFPFPSQILVLKNHGLLTGGKTVEEAFYNLYFLLNFCSAYVDSGYIANANIGKAVAIEESVISKAQMGALTVRGETAIGIMEFEGLARQLDYEGLHTGYPFSGPSKDLVERYKTLD